MAWPAGLALPRPRSPCRGIPQYHKRRPGPYNGFMTTTHDHTAASVAQQFARAGSFLEGLAAQDFTKLGGALAADACLRALLPSGLR